MLRSTSTICNKLGLHARAAAKLVTVASKYESEIVLSNNGNDADGKSIMGLMMLVAPNGTELEIRTTGADELEALHAIQTLIGDRFGEEE